jgi:hypothetical protein
MAKQGIHSVREIVRDIPVVLRDSFTARFAVIGLSSVIVYLIIGQLLRPGYTDYWWYQFFQTSAALMIVLFFNAAFASDGGLPISTHVIVIGATLADTTGNTFGFYQSWEPYDKIVHFASSAAFAAGTFQALNFLSRRGILTWSPLKRGVVSFSASLFVCGFVWETYEYMGDAVFNSGRIQSRADTVGDLIADALGALMAVVLIFRHERKHQRTAAARRTESMQFQAVPEQYRTPLHPSHTNKERDLVYTPGGTSLDD